jgi:hypothetical protein
MYRVPCPLTIVWQAEWDTWMENIAKIGEIYDICHSFIFSEGLNNVVGFLCGSE